MTEESKLRIIGPYNVDRTGNPDAQELELYNVDSSSINASTDASGESIPGFDSDDTILAPLTGSVSRSADGRGVPQRIHAGVRSGTVTQSLRVWIYSLEALVLPQQGGGYEFDSDVRGGEYVPTPTERGFLIENISWSLNASDIDTFDWNIDAQLAEGVQAVDESPDEYVQRQFDTPNVETDSVEVNGLTIEFDEIDDRRVSREVPVEANDLLHGADIPVAGVMQEGVSETVEFSGTIVDEDIVALRESTKQFDQQLQGKEATINDTFTNRPFEGTITESRSELSSGQPRSFEFSLTLEVGRVAGSN